MKTLTFAKAGVAMFGFLAAGTAQAVSYTITDLGTLGGSFSVGYSLNDAGQIVGDSQTDTFQIRPFLYSNGALTDLGLMGGGGATASGINASGQVAGTISFSNGENIAYVNSNGTTVMLGNLGYADSQANAINASGDVVGYSSIVEGGTIQRRAALFSNGTVTNLGTLGGVFSEANAINNAGQVVGSSRLANIVNGTSVTAVTHAFVYSNGVMMSLGTLGSNFSVASAINDGGVIVGYSDLADGQRRAFRFSNGTMTDLGTLDSGFAFNFSEAYGINDAGMIVGRSLAGGEAAFLHDGTSMVNLNSLIDPQSGWQLRWAYDINNNGQITGYGSFNGQTRAFLLSPVGFGDPPTGAVPEPASWAMLIAGFGLVGAMQRRRKNAVAA